MRLAVVGCALCALMNGCSTGPFFSRGPLLEELEADKVHLQKRQSVKNADVYKVTYAVQAPLEICWHAPVDVAAWLQSTDLISNVIPCSESELDNDLDSGLEEEGYEIELRRSKVRYPIVLIRDDARKMIEIRSLAGEQNPKEVSYCSIKMQPFLEGSTLVEAELHVTGDLLSVLEGLVLLPARLIVGNWEDTWLHRFANELAQEHRVKSETGPPLPPNVRTHVVAIGVDRLADSAHEQAFRVQALKCAANDARQFYEWAVGAYAINEDDDSIIHELLTEDATAHNVSKLLTEIGDRCYNGRVRSGDTVLFFFAGQIVVGRNIHARGAGSDEVPHLLTVDADRSRLSFTAIERGEVLEALQRSQASRCLLFCDAPFAGGFRVHAAQLRREPGAEPAPLTSSQVGSSTAVFAAEYRHVLAAEDEARRHGIFTFALLEGLRGAADTDGNGVSAAELQKYVWNWVSKLTNDVQAPYAYFPPDYAIDAPIIPDQVTAQGD